MTEKSGQNQAGRFQKGMSGNPNGKPKGVRARVTQLAEKLLEDDRDAIVRAVIAAAKAARPCAFVLRGLCLSARAGLSYSICRRLKRPLTLPRPSVSYRGPWLLAS
jgi:hypothetical protein